MKLNYVENDSLAEGWNKYSCCMCVTIFLVEVVRRNYKKVPHNTHMVKAYNAIKTSR